MVEKLGRRAKSGVVRDVMTVAPIAAVAAVVLLLEVS